MATLPTIRPNETVPFQSGAVTWGHDQVNDSSDTTFCRTDISPNGSGYWQFGLESMPADFLSMDSYTITVRVGLSTAGTDDTWGVEAHLAFNTTGNDAVTPPSQSSLNITTTAVQEFSFTPALPATNTRVAWVNYNVKIGWTNTRSMSADSNVLRVYDVWITGTYTQDAVTHQATASGASTTSGSAAAVRLLQITSSGASTSSGSASPILILFSSASGSSTSSGSAAATIKSFATASGTSLTDGLATASQRFSAESTGTSTTAGSAAATRQLTATASGSSTTTGSAAASIVTSLQATASGASTTTGSAAADITMTHAAQASGASTSTGTSQALIPALRAGASGTSTTAGSASVSALLVASASGASVSVGVAFTTSSISQDLLATWNVTFETTKYLSLSGSVSTGVQALNVTVPFYNQRVVQQVATWR